MLGTVPIEIQETENVELIRVSPIPNHGMETRKNRTPSARLLASKQDDGMDKVTHLPPHLPPKQTNLSSSTLASQLAKVAGDTTPIRPMHMAHSSVLRLEKDHTPIEEDIDIATEMDVSPHKEVLHHEELIPEEMMKEGKIDASVLNGAFTVSNEVTITSQKYPGRAPAHRKYDNGGSSGSHRGHFTGETLNLKSSDLSIPNKAAHFLYFRCYEEGEVQKEFPLTIDETRKGPQNFLVEPRVGLKNTDYYIDSYLWNRGKSTSSKKKIFVEIDGSHVKTSRRSIESAHYLLNWYYSNMENRICKKVCWLESIGEGVRTSPVLVQYHVNYLSDNPIEIRKTPKLYSDTRTVAQELLRSDSPLQTVARFVETGETDPREIINKKQAYEMRRYVLASARRKNTPRKSNYEDMYYQDEFGGGEIYYDEHGEPHLAPRGRGNAEIERIATLACRTFGRKMEHRISSMLDNRFGTQKLQADMVSEWINSLVQATPEDCQYVVNEVVSSMRKQLDELVAAESHEYIEEAGTSEVHLKRRLHDDDEAGPSSKQRFDGEQYIFEGEEYVEEVIAEDINEEVVTTSSNGEGRDEEKYNSGGEQAFFFPAGTTSDVSGDQ